jgi:hypothetical protein
MTKPKHVLAFVSRGDGELIVHADARGLEVLANTISCVQAKLRKGECEHEHLMTDAWAGSELSEKIGSTPGALIHHVRLCGWTDAKAAELGLYDETA